MSLALYAKDPDLCDAVAEDRRRIIGWLQHGKDLDPATKLPRSTIAEVRIVDDARLGPVPQGVCAARRSALAAVITDQLEQARSLDGGRVDPLASAISEVTASQSTFFPKMVLTMTWPPNALPSSTSSGDTRPPRKRCDARQQTAGHPSTSRTSGEQCPPTAADQPAQAGHNGQERRSTRPHHGAPRDALA